MKRSVTRLFPVGLEVWTSTALTCAVLLVASAPTAQAAGVVGTGTAASCTDAALNTALTGGGLVTFNCGGGLVTIDISPGAGGTGTKSIAVDTTIDGGSLITISGGNSVGVFSVSQGVKFTVQNLTIANGSSADGGGGISNGGIPNGGGTLTVTNSTFSGNNGAAGGGIFNNGTLTVTNSTFSGNGGGIFSTGGLLTVTNSTFSGNSASGGGGILNDGGTLTVTNSTFSGNNASITLFGGGVGGAIANDGMLTVTNSTFSGNSATTTGGAIANDSGMLTVTNSTFSGNSASIGGSVFNSGSAVTVTNTIVANSTSGGNCDGSVTDGGHNIDDGTTCGFTGTGCTSTSGSSFCSTNPQLDPTGLQNNGGPTRTIALCTGAGAPSAGCTEASPGINAGDESVCSTTTGTAPVDNLDQRGFVRPGVGATNCSIGAFEANSASPCIGDCNGTGQVTVDEILTLVNIALGNAEMSECEIGDANKDGQITVDEILMAVNNALNGCPLTPEQGCLGSGGTVTTATCCASTSDFPDTCAVGACGCPPDASHEVRVCNCGTGSCFDGSGCVRQ